MRRPPAPPPAPPPMDAAPPSSNPVCYAAIRDVPTQKRLQAELERLGWRVVLVPTGFHIIDALSGAILGETASAGVGLVVVEDPLPGLRGSTIARGLRELGIEIPVAVIAADPQEVARLEQQRVVVLEPQLAAIGVSALARHRHPGRSQHPYAAA